METLRQMAENFNTRFDQVMERLDANDAKFSENDGKFDRIFQEIQDIRSVLGAIQRKLEA
jgi:hypothetical protein